eukprot:1190355-Prorocentrum_minimum.AAC.3
MSPAAFGFWGFGGETLLPPEETLNWSIMRIYPRFPHLIGPSRHPAKAPARTANTRETPSPRPPPTGHVNQHGADPTLVRPRRPIVRRKRGYILVMDQLDAGSAGIFS